MKIDVVPAAVVAVANVVLAMVTAPMVEVDVAVDMVVEIEGALVRMSSVLGIVVTIFMVVEEIEVITKRVLTEA